MSETGFMSAWEHAASDGDNYLLFLRITKKAIQRGEHPELSKDPLFTHIDGGKSFDYLKAACWCVLDDESETVKEYFLGTNLVKSIRLADALNITLEELETKLSVEAKSSTAQP